MREASWSECLDSGSAIRASGDMFRARSLAETARGRVGFLKGNQEGPENANYLFEGYYTSVLEMLHALMVKHGFRVRNHICAGYYLRDVLKRENLFRDFSDMRYRRNSLTYYGKMMGFGSAKEAIEKAMGLFMKLEGLLRASGEV